MTDISIILPARNEQRRLPSTLAAINWHMARFDYTWECLIVVNGSRDRTKEIAENFSRLQSRFHVILSPPGKGVAVGVGMLTATGQYRYMCDVDLSTPIQCLSSFLTWADGGYDVVIGSREAPNSTRIGEPPRRHLMGRAFNLATRVITGLPYQDTQAGFKLFTAQAAERLFRLQTIHGWGFDVEILYLARMYGLLVGEVGIPWTYNGDSRVRPVRDSYYMLRDLIQIRVNHLTGVYARRNYVTQE